MRDFKSFYLMSEKCSTAKSALRRKPSVSSETTLQHFFKYKVWCGLEVTGPYDIPVIRHYSVTDLPDKVIPFHEAIKTKDYNSIVHFLFKRSIIY